MTRLEGLFILFKTIAPIVLIILFALTLNNALSDLRQRLEPSLDIINQRTEQLKNNFAVITENTENLISRVSLVTNRVNQLSSLIPTIPTQLTIPAITVPTPNAFPVPNVSLTPRTIRYPSGIEFETVQLLGIPLIPRALTITWSNASVPTISVATTQQTIAIPQIPAFTLTVPGLGPAAAAINALRETFSPVRDAFDTVTTLGSTLDEIGGDFNKVASETAAVLNGIRDTSTQWGQQALLLTVALLLVLGIIFAVTILNNLRIGWHMLLTDQKP